MLQHLAYDVFYLGVEMTAVLTSQVTQLLYRVTPILNFAQIVGDLRHAFVSKAGEAPTLTWDCDDIALLDFGAARIVIGFSEKLPGPNIACLTVAIGQSPLQNDADLTAADQFLLSEAVTERLSQRFPSDAQRSQTLTHPFPLTSDLIDHVVDALFQQDGDKSRPEIAAPAAPLSVDIAPTPVGGEPSDMERLMHRLSSELTARTPSLISRAIASATPRGRKTAAKGRATPFTEPVVSDAETRPEIEKTPKARGRLFWSKTSASHQAAHPDPVQSPPQARKAASSSELKAVRDALYAQDMSKGQSGTRIAAQTRHALQSLTALPLSLAAVLADRRRGTAMIGNRIKH